MRSQGRAAHPNSASPDLLDPSRWRGFSPRCSRPESWKIQPGVRLEAEPGVVDKFMKNLGFTEFSKIPLALRYILRYSLRYILDKEVQHYVWKTICKRSFEHEGRGGCGARHDRRHGVGRREHDAARGEGMKAGMSRLAEAGSRCRAADMDEVGMDLAGRRVWRLRARFWTRIRAGSRADVRRRRDQACDSEAALERAELRLPADQDNGSPAGRRIYAERRRGLSHADDARRRGPDCGQRRPMARRSTA